MKSIWQEQTQKRLHRFFGTDDIKDQRFNEEIKKRKELRYSLLECRKTQLKKYRELCIDESNASIINYTVQESINEYRLMI